MWATERLREYIVKGFTMDDERLKNAGEGMYWKELLDRPSFDETRRKETASRLPRNGFQASLGRILNAEMADREEAADKGFFHKPELLEA